jgi:hypothetical protein
MRRRTTICLLAMVAGAGIFLSPEIFARPVGGFAPRSSPAVHAFRPATPRAPFLHGSGFNRHAFRAPFLRHRHFGRGFPGFWGAWPWYDPYNYGYGSYDGYTGDTGSLGYGAPYAPPPSPYTGGPYPPAIAYPDASKKPIYVVPYRPGCDTETETLPWRNGSKHSVRIVRC